LFDLSFFRLIYLSFRLIYLSKSSYTSICCSSKRRWQISGDVFCVSLNSTTSSRHSDVTRFQTFSKVGIHSTGSTQVKLRHLVLN